MNGSGMVEPGVRLKSCIQSAARLAISAVFLQCSNYGICQSMEFETGPFKVNLYDASPLNLKLINAATAAPSKIATNLPTNFASSSAASSTPNLANSAMGNIGNLVSTTTDSSPSSAQSAGSLGSAESTPALLAQSSQLGNRVPSAASSTATGAAASERDSDRSTSGKQSVKMLLDDSVLTAKVKAAMIADASVKNNQISVETNGGEVTLSGTVATAQEITQAGEIAGNTVGVKAVVNKLRLKKQ